MSGGPCVRAIGVAGEQSVADRSATASPSTAPWRAATTSTTSGGSRSAANRWTPAS